MTLLKFCVVFFLTCFIGRWFANDAATSVGLYALVTVPGTFMHELAHYVAALLTEGNPTGFSIIPQGDTLGHVLVSPNWYNAALIGVAPLFLAPLTLLFMVLAAKRSTIGLLVFSYMAACCWAACIPSDVDLDIAMSHVGSWLLAAPALLGLSALVVWLSFKLLRFQHANTI